VAVTAFTQISRTSKTLPLPLAYPGIEQEDEPFRYWYFSGSKEVYVAPHAPFYLKAYDLDGHQMTQFSPLAVNAEPLNSNRRLECFQGAVSGTQFTCFTGTKVQKLTAEVLQAHISTLTSLPTPHYKHHVVAWESPTHGRYLTRRMSSSVQSSLTAMGLRATCSNSTSILGRAAALL
jgi:hypothetical protein